MRIMPQNLLESDEDGLKEPTSPDHGGEIWKASMELGVVPNKLLDFSANVNPLGCSPLAKMALKRSLGLVSFYPDNECIELRRAIASFIRKKIEPANIFVGNGAADIIHLFARAFIKNGCDAIVTQPTFSEYEYATLLQRGNPIHAMRLENFELDPEMLFKNMTGRTSALFICNPNNPTGTTQERRIIEKIVQEAANANVMVLLDECFVDFVKDQSKVSLSSVVRKYRNLVVLRSLTKTFGLAGLRAGYAIGHEATVRLLEKQKITWSVNTFAQIAAIAALKDMKFLERSLQLVKKERAFLERTLRELGMEVMPSEANFLLARLHGRVDAGELKMRLMKRRIVIRDCSRFRGLGSQFIRLAVKTRQENEALLHALRQELL